MSLAISALFGSVKSDLGSLAAVIAILASIVGGIHLLLFLTHVRKQ
jgi:hypothetical protein